MTRYYIHDLDDNLQRFKPQAEAVMNEACARAAIEDCGVGLGLQEAMDLIKESIATRQSHFQLFIERHGVDWDTLHLSYNQRVDRSIIDPIPQLPASLAALGSKAEHCILTHSHMLWASECVDLNKIRPWFPDQRIVTLEMYKEEPKHIGTKGFELALSRLGGPDPKDTVFTDDTPANLVTAKKMGMQTVWSSHGRVLPAAFSAYIDHVAHDACEFLQKLAIPPAPRTNRKPGGPAGP